jgi:arginase
MFTFQSIPNMPVARLHMKLPAFFKIKSRIGLKNAPIHQREPNVGVEDGPDAVISGEFLNSFPQSPVYTYKFAKPEEVLPTFFNQVLAKSVAECRDAINRSLRPDQTQVVIGGDHSVTFPSVLAVIERMNIGEEMGYIQFDSHADINLQATSPTDNFHGMYVRALVDHFDIPEIEALVPQKLPTSNLLYIGNLDLDPAEQKFFDERAIRNLTKSDLVERKSQSLETLRHFISCFTHLHITFDLDCLHERVAPATGIPAADGLELAHVVEMFDLLSQHTSFSLDVVEVNPRRPGAKQTIQVAQNVVKHFF